MTIYILLGLIWLFFWIVEKLANYGVDSNHRVNSTTVRTRKRLPKKRPYVKPTTEKEFKVLRESALVKVGCCNVCGDKMLDQIIYCRGCHTGYHRDCWQFVGKCAVYGCQRKQYLLKTTVARQRRESRSKVN